MRNIRALFFALLGLTAVTSIALAAISITFAISAVLTVWMVARVICARPAMAPVKAETKRKETFRVWNDGRGTIIDL